MPSETDALFSSLPLRAELQQALNAVNYITMSPIQAASASAILDGRDLLAEAETGSGKTAAFAIGLLNKLDVGQFQTQALIICPTRELSDQVAAEIRRLASGLANTRVVTLCGGKPMHDQLTSLKRDPHIVVGTPGRLKKHLELDTLDLSRIQTLVLDEADRMLDMGFFDDIKRILDKTSDKKQTLLFSATYPPEIVEISRAIQNNPLEVRVEASNTVDQIRQLFVVASDKEKNECLFRVLGKYQPDNAIIFCNRKDTVQAVATALSQRGVSARALHGDMDQRDRDETIILFANQSLSYLVATDVAARGLDISDLSAVINYDISRDPETHVHRIGRTGRAGKEGLAISFVTPREERQVDAIEALLNTELDFIELEAADRNDASIGTPPMVTLQINAGKKDKIRPGDIVGVLTSESELTNDHIGKIKVQAKVSFVAVETAKHKIALKVLSEGRIKRRSVRVRVLG